MQSSALTSMSLRTGFAPQVIGFICVYLGTYDGTAWAVVLPEIAGQLELDLIVAQWVVLAPIIMTAALLLVMGNLADKIGHRQVLYYGLAAYVAGALLVILSSGFALLIVARFLMGASMAVLYTVGPAFTVRAFVPSQRARALAVVGVTTSIGLVSGPLLGGLMTTVFGWRNLLWPTLVILAVCLLVIFIASRTGLCERLWETPRRPARRFDLRGAVLMVLWQGPLLFAITLGNERGWLSPEILGAGAIALMMLALFVYLQLNTADPTVEFRLFKLRDFRLPVLAAFLGFMAVTVGFLLLPIYMARVLGLSPFIIGLVYASSPAMMFFAAPLAAIWAERAAPRRPATLGLALIGLGSLLLLLLQTDSPAWLLLLLFPVVGLGLGTFEWTINTSIVGSLPRSMLGVSAGFLATARTFGFTAGQAVWGLTFTLVVTSQAGTAEALDAGPEDLLLGYRVCLAAAALVALLGAYLAFRQRDNPAPASEAEIAALRPS